MTLLLCALFGYLLGSIPFAVIISHMFNLADPRSFGSGNPGATNVLRSGNKTAAALTLLGDASKGYLAMLFAGSLSGSWHGAAIAGVCAFFGHVFPVFLRFKGGKGVATALGVLFGFSAALAVTCAFIWLMMAYMFRYSSLAALAAALAAPLLAWGYVDVITSAYIAPLTLMLLWRHRANILRLYAGTEGRIGR